MYHGALRNGNAHWTNVSILFTGSFDPLFIFSIIFIHFDPMKMKVIDDLFSSIAAFPKNEQEDGLKL